MSNSSQPSQRNPLRRKIAFTIVLMLACAVLAEVTFRLLEGVLHVDTAKIERWQRFVRTGESTIYEPHPYLLYTHPRTTSVYNSFGFDDEEHALAKTAGVMRIACLGASTTESGNDVGRAGAYPHFLDEALRREVGRPFEVMNWGMSGWTSAEIMLNYFVAVQDFEPDVVIFHEAINDFASRVRPGYRADYVHYRRPWTQPHFGIAHRLLTSWSHLLSAFEMRKLAINDVATFVTVPTAPVFPKDHVPPPGTTAGFRRNVRTICEHVRARGGRAVLATLPHNRAMDVSKEIACRAIVEHNQILRDVALETGAFLVDLDAEARAHPEAIDPQFVDLVHLTPDGNRFKAERIAEALLREGVVAR
jgi:lysophospholipase L1-like esterase